MDNDKKQQIIELLKDKEVADSIGAISEGLVKLFESIPTDKPEEKELSIDDRWYPEIGEDYFEVSLDTDSRIRVMHNRFPTEVDFDNCWKTKERAKDVAKKVRCLMLIEQIADIVCPDLAYYSPDSCHNAVVYSNGLNCFYSIYRVGTADLLETRFPSEACAYKFCDILNKMKADGQLDWLFDE